MITNLEDCRTNLISQLEKLKREIEVLKWPEHLEDRKTNLISRLEKLKREIKVLNWPNNKELTLLCYTGGARDLGHNRLQKS